MSRITATHILVAYVCLLLAACVGFGIYIFVQNETHPRPVIESCAERKP